MTDRVQHDTQLPPATNHKHHANISKYFLIGVAAIILLVISFEAGMHYQKNQNRSSNTAAKSIPGNSSFGGGFSRYANGQRPIVGQVTAISSSSISVQNNRTGSTSALSITSSTTITDNGQTASVSDIQTGDKVVIISSSSDSAQASKILINPNFGGGNGQNNSSSGSNGSSTNETNSNNTGLLE